MDRKGLVLGTSGKTSKSTEMSGEDIDMTANNKDYEVELMAEGTQEEIPVSGGLKLITAI